MLSRRTRADLLAAVATVFIGAVVACGADTASSSAGLSSTPPCPSSFGDVATASCRVEGQSCTYLVPCATFASNAICTCSGGAFTCTGYGDAGTACVALATTGKCPLSEVAANGLFCSDLGLVCTYASACSGIPAYDSCQCVGGRTADEQAHYECTSPCQADAAPMTSAPLDASTPDAGPPDANPPADAQSPDDSPADAPSSLDGN
jgi:hypothetical protein